MANDTQTTGEHRRYVGGVLLASTYPEDCICDAKPSCPVHEPDTRDSDGEPWTERARGDFWTGVDALEGWLQDHAVWIPWFFFLVGFVVGVLV